MKNFIELKSCLSKAQVSHAQTIAQDLRQLATWSGRATNRLIK